ncbi:MAG: helix-turn-helix domain-containing protein [Pseudomonadota bacterium]
MTMLSVLVNISLIFIGFSILSAILLLSVYWFVYKAFEKTWLSKVACMSVMIGIACIQVLHMRYLHNETSIFTSVEYRVLLCIVAPSFYLFSREILQVNPAAPLRLIIHFAPILFIPFINYKVAIPLAFTIGTGYALWLSIQVYRLKLQRQYFLLEFLTLAGFTIMALLVLVSGLCAAFIGEQFFVMAYANLIGITLFAIIYIQLRFPEITQKTVDAVVASYAASTLTKMDCEPLVVRIKHLLDEQKLYRNEDLSLAHLAEDLSLSSHQVSELINTCFGMGFSRLIRNYRVEEAKRQLIEEPKASVLSIGMAVGFSSQSNFYTAFRDFTGETPGQFRKRQGVIEPA